MAVCKNKDVQYLVDKLQSFTSGGSVHTRNSLVGNLRMCVYNKYDTDSYDFKSVAEVVKLYIKQVDSGLAITHYVSYRCKQCGKKITFHITSGLDIQSEVVPILSRVGWKMKKNSKELLCHKCLLESTLDITSLCATLSLSSGGGK